MKLKGILLDLDNTLYEYEPCNTAALKKIFTVVSEKYNVNEDEVKKRFYDARKKVKDTLKETASSHARLLYFKTMIEEITDKSDPQFTLELDTLFWEEYFKHMQLNPYALKFLEECKKRGIDIAIITDLTTQIQLKKIIHLNISEYIKHIITSEELGYEKPDPRVFQNALNKLSCSAEEAIMIGDDEVKDITSAENLGIKAFYSIEEALSKVKENM